MNDQVLKELKDVFNSGTKNLDKACTYQILNEELMTAIIVYEKDISEEFVDYSIEFKELKRVFLVYRGQVNKTLQPSGDGTFMSVAEIAYENLNGDYVTDFQEIEIFEGKWEKGNLCRGTYETPTSLNDINSPVMKTKLYEFYVNGILGAEDNPGKKQVSTVISYEGTFNGDKLFHGNDGELIIYYTIDWIRQFEYENGTMNFKGTFEHGSIVFGEYNGPYIGFNTVYDKKIKYKGQFKDNLFNGNGTLKYNLDGGYRYHDRITCEYSGGFRDGIKSGENAIETLMDKENSVEIKIFNCKFEEHFLIETQSIIYKSEANSILGFEERDVKVKEVKFEGELNTLLEYILLPNDISEMLGEGCLTVLNDTYSSKLYKNYGEDGLDGTYKYLYGKIILDGTFYCLDELTKKTSYEKWRCGYLVEQANELEDILNLDPKQLLNNFTDELLDNGKDAMKRLLSTVVASKVFEANLFILYILVGILGTLLKSGKDAILKNISKSKKEELIRVVRASVNSINGEKKELELQVEFYKELSEFNSKAVQFRGGIRWKRYEENQRLDDVKFEVNKAKRLFLKTSQHFEEVLGILNGNEKLFINNFLISLDNLERDYEDLEKIYKELLIFDMNEIKEVDIIPINNKLLIFNQSYIRLIDIFRHALVKVNEWLDEN